MEAACTAPSLIDRIDAGIDALADDGLIPSQVQLCRKDMEEFGELAGLPPGARLLAHPRYRNVILRAAPKRTQSIVVGRGPGTPARVQQEI